LTDAQLIAEYQKRQQQQYIGELFKRYSHLVLGVCIKYLGNVEQSKDEVQAIFEKLMLDLKQHDVSNFKAWLFMVTKNHCLQLLRQKKRNLNKDEEAHSEWEFADSVEEKVQQEIREENLHEAIKQLKDEQRICIELFYLQNKSYRAIEELTGLTNKQVKSYIQNGKRNLKLMITQDESAFQ